MRAAATLLAALLPLAAQAFQNEPDGFRGHAWGAPPDADKFVRALPPDERQRAMYQKRADPLTIGGAQLKSISYIFYKDRLSDVFITTEDGPVNKRAIRDAVTEQFGPGQQPNRFIDTWFWRGTRTYISLNCSTTQTHCTLLIGSRALNDERRAEDAQRARDAKKDF